MLSLPSDTVALPVASFTSTIEAVKLSTPLSVVVTVTAPDLTSPISMLAASVPLADAPLPVKSTVRTPPVAPRAVGATENVPSRA